MKPNEAEDHIGNPTGATAFLGYAPPTSSTTYTPNQFFDVVLPVASRGCLRLVAYLIRKTLGWSDEHGNPQNPETTVTYRELIEKAGIGRGRIKEAIEEAISSRYINCLRLGQPHKAGEEGFSALYSLRWDERESYITNPDEFDGFYAGNGNLTHIPNDFFDYTIPNETLALVKVVGVIIRHTIGFQTKYGFRRQQVEMSFSEIMRRAGIASRSTMNIAIKEALDKNHVCKVAEGFFDPNAGVTSCAASYGIRWLDQTLEKPQVEPKSANGSKIEPANRFRNRTEKVETVPKSNRGIGSEIEPANGSKIEPESVPKSNRDEFRNRTASKTTDLNNPSKQQQIVADAVVVRTELLASFKMLQEVGFDEDAAKALASKSTEQVILKQIEALELRKVSRNKLGMLRKSIEEDWPLPDADDLGEHSDGGQEFVGNFYAALAGRQGEPSVTATKHELEQASRFVESINRQLGEELDESTLGRKLGQFVRQNQDPSKGPIRSLSYAMRAFGDRFFIKVEEEEKARKREVTDRARRAHEEKYSEEFAQYHRGLLQQFSDQDPLVVERFEQGVQTRIDRMVNMSPRYVERMNQSFSDPNERAQMFVEFLKTDTEFEVLEFWAWDAKMNPAPFSMEGNI